MSKKMLVVRDIPSNKIFSLVPNQTPSDDNNKENEAPINFECNPRQDETNARIRTNLFNNSCVTTGSRVPLRELGNNTINHPTKTKLNDVRSSEDAEFTFHMSQGIPREPKDYYNLKIRLRQAYLTFLFKFDINDIKAYHITYRAIMLLDRCWANYLSRVRVTVSDVVNWANVCTLSVLSLENTYGEVSNLFSDEFMVRNIPATQMRILEITRNCGIPTVTPFAVLDWYLEVQPRSINTREMIEEVLDIIHTSNIDDYKPSIVTASALSVYNSSRPGLPVWTRDFEAIAPFSQDLDNCIREMRRRLVQTVSLEQENA